MATAKLGTAGALALVWALHLAACQPATLKPGTGGHDAAAADVGADTGAETVADIGQAQAETAGSKDPAPMVAFAAGQFYQGASAAEIQSGAAFQSESPQHLAKVALFSLDQHEVTVAQYTDCVADGACTEPNVTTAIAACNWGAAGRQSHPVNCLTWAQANTYCLWAGKRLPTEAEWEYAARGGKELADPPAYPWGSDAPDCDRVVFKGPANAPCGGYTQPVCSKPKGNTAQGLCDMGGNVWEFCSDWYGAYSAAPQTNPKGPPQGNAKAMRGGASSVPADAVRCAMRADVPTDKAFSDIGFRCAK